MSRGHRGLRILGHPLHAMLSDFPMVLLMGWALADGAGSLLPSPPLWEAGRWALVAGLGAAGLAAIAGFIDYVALSGSKPKAVKTATIHMTLMLSAVCIALTALIFRTRELPDGASRTLHVCACAAVALCLGAGGWFGGHLVFHHGAFVDRSADVADGTEEP
jgi:uncharacterized membrane protein